MTVKKKPNGCTGANGVFSMKSKTNGKRRSTIKRPDGPKSVSLVALGPSSLSWNRQAEMMGGRRYCSDQVWTVNTYGDVLLHDLLWHMDDVRIQEIRAKAGNTKISKMLDWMKKHDKPIMTSRAHPDYPALVEFPLEDVVNALGLPYFNGTTAYAIAYAIYIGVKELTLYGFDFTYPDAHHAEKGRGCCEYWCGQAMARGVEIRAPDTSTFMDAWLPMKERFYGYDTQDIACEMANGKIKIGLTERDTLPTADEIEDRYDHSKNPTIDPRASHSALNVGRGEKPFTRRGITHKELTKD